MPREQYAIVQTWAQFDAMMDDLNAASILAVDLETEGFSWKHDPIVGWALSGREHSGYYVPVGHRFGEQLPRDEVTARLKPLLENAKKIVIHNAKFDTRFLRVVGIDLRTGCKADGNPDQVEDTLLEAYVAAMDESMAGRFGLKELEERVFKVKPVSFDDLFPPRTKIKNIATVDIETAGYYACADADYCWRFHARYNPRVLGKFIYMIESRLWPIVQKIEERGVLVDAEALRKMAAYVAEEAEKIEAIVLDQVEKAVGRRISFSISSPKQLGEVLYDLMGIPVKVKTPSGAPATNELALAALEDQYPVCRNILTFRSMLSNVRSMLGWCDKIDHDDGRIHTSYNQAGATSGRFASSDPNVQNIGKKKKWLVFRADGTRYEVTITPRDAFIAAPGKYLVELDFSAIEFIIMAALSGETKIVDAYLRGDDVHKLTAADVYGISVESVTEAQRDLAKTVNYLTIYGGSADRLSKETLKPLAECEDFMRKFFQVRPKFQQYMQATRDGAVRERRVETRFGRSQIVPEFFEPGRQAASKALRACVNRVIQGTAADVQKMGLIRTHEAMAKRYTEEEAQLILQTHDSQTWEVDQRISPEVIIPQLVDLMGRQLKGLPRIFVDAKLGKMWGSLVKFDREAIQKKYPEWDGTWSAFFAYQDEFHLHAYDEMPEPRELGVDADEQVAKAMREHTTDGFRLILNPGQVIEAEHAAKLKETVSAFPGRNVVVIKTVEGREVVWDKRPTELNVVTLVAACRAFLPECTAEVDRAALLAAVIGSG